MESESNLVHPTNCSEPAAEVSVDCSDVVLQTTIESSAAEKADAAIEGELCDTMKLADISKNETTPESETAKTESTAASTPLPASEEADPRVATLRANITEELNSLLTDYDCLRFLRARSYDIKKTTEMVKKWGEWWATPLVGTEILPGDITKKPDPQEPTYRELLPHANLSENKDGLPIYWERTGHSKYTIHKHCFQHFIISTFQHSLFALLTHSLTVSSTFHEVKKHLSEDDMFIRHIRQQEMMIGRLKRASEKYGRNIEKQVIVMDMKNLSMSIDFMALRVFKRTLVVDEACYPERLETLYMINAPFTFSVVWAMIKPWIDPVTVNKFKILGSNYAEELKKNIAEDQIPVEYGGTREDFFWTVPENRDWVDVFEE
jgi:hypothetical protein